MTPHGARGNFSITVALGTFLGIYAAARVLQVFPGRVPMMAIVLLHVLPPAVFALIHGGILYGVRGVLAFTALCLGVAGIFETLGILTGFPFGHYSFTAVMGPKIFKVPVLLALAYLGMGYLAWTLAAIILRTGRAPLAPSRVVALPLLASFIMVAWDLAMDPVWSTIVHAWTWTGGGPWFGVPVSNFLGWYLTVWVFYQAFALFLRGRHLRPNPLPRGFWQLAVLFYAVSAAGNVLLMIPQTGPAVVSDPAGTQWKVSQITAAAALVSIFTMGAFAALAWMRLADRDA